MTRNYDKLKTLLIELFQLDQPDLDFGLYRIMHAKSAEVTQFLDRELLPQVTAAFGQFRSADKAEMERELNKVIAGVEAAGMEPEQSPKVQALREQLKNDGVDVGRLESEVYDHLFSFFRRYYSEGDFLAKRVYKPGVYAIPYEGEEVMLHWANKDQYYIKTSEYLRDYAFRLRPDLEEMPMRVHFRLVDVAEGEHGNVKASEGKERRFKLAEENPVTLEDGELMIRFTYQPDTAKQKELNAAAEEAIAAMEDASLKAWITELGKPNVRSDGSSSGTCLRLHLDRYTARNTFDYFIHKDLGGFLRRELDFFIKNEVMHLDDIENESAPRVEQYLSKIKVIRKIAGKIIDFLAQLENFQKRLWLKKKFVVETHYCITLDRIPAEFYGEIAANPKQWEQWRSLGMLETANVDQPDLFSQAEVGSVGYLEAHPFLMVDTALFDEAFKRRLLSTVENLDETLDGLLMHGDNFHGLNLLQARYREQVNCIHIDPPYNTDTSGFAYKNNYRHSSWLTLMDSRLQSSLQLLAVDGQYVCHIDENEYEKLHLLFEETGIGNAGTVVWDKRNPMNGGAGVATQHEYIIWRTVGEIPLSQPNSSVLSMIAQVRKMVEAEGRVTDAVRKRYAAWLNANAQLSGGEKAYRYLDADANIYQSVSLRAPEPRDDPKFHEPLIHPRTSKPCAVPPNGFSRTPETLQAMIKRGEILFGEDETTQPRQKVILTQDTSRQLSSLIQDAKKGKADMAMMGIEFPYCHPTSLYELIVSVATKAQGLILDYFAGSGTTAHAVISLNRQDQGKRKYILVEQGDYFDTVLKPRIQKVVYSSE